VVRLWEHVPLDEAVTTVVTALTASGVAAAAPGPAEAPGPREPDQDQPRNQPGDDSLS